MIPDDKWQCTGCKEIYANEDDREENNDYAEQFFCDECDGGKEKPYCGDCSIYFDEIQITICPRCLEKAMNECKNIKGKVVEKIVEKPIYIKEGVIHAEESMEDFEKRILGG